MPNCVNSEGCDSPWAKDQAAWANRTAVGRCPASEISCDAATDVTASAFLSRPAEPARPAQPAGPAPSAWVDSPRWPFPTWPGTDGCLDRCDPQAPERPIAAGRAGVSHRLLHCLKEVRMATEPREGSGPCRTFVRTRRRRGSGTGYNSHGPSSGQSSPAT